MGQQIITIIGGTGFIGRYAVKRLAAAGYTIRVIARHTEAALHLKTSGTVGQIVLMSGNLAEPQSLNGKLEGSAAVINLTGILYESGRQKFDRIHAHGAEKLAQLAKSLGIPRFIHLSALGVDKAAGSRYARSKVLGEKAVLAAFPEATILRPSVVFGPEDHFFNLFASLAGFSPALPLIGGGATKFQPVYAGDVAKAIEACLLRPETMGRTYELGGPHIYSFRQILEYILDIIGKQRALIPLPFAFASFKAFFLEFLPRPLLTRDQVTLLRYDNVVSLEALTFTDLGIHPTAVEIVAPDYLARFRKKAAA